MADPPLLSFCVFTYNRALLLAQVLDQMLQVRSAFTEGTIEIVVSDNCSTDDTVAMLRQRYVPRGIRLVVQDSNIGGSRNWLAAIRQSSGIYVWPFADDDLLHVSDVIATIGTHLRRGMADFYRVNFVAGYYHGPPRERATLTQIGHCVDCDIILPDMAALIPYCGIIARGVIIYGNILRGDVVRQCDWKDFLPLDEFLDQAEVLLRLFKHRRTALLHRCLMFLLTPQLGPRWAADAPGGLPGSYIFTILLMRRMVRMIENRTIHPGLIEADGLLKVERLAESSYVTVRFKLPHYLYHETLNFLDEYGEKLSQEDCATIGAFARYLADPAMKLLFGALQRYGAGRDANLWRQLLGFRGRVLQCGPTSMWHATQCAAYERYVARQLDTSHLGVREMALA